METKKGIISFVHDKFYPHVIIDLLIVIAAIVLAGLVFIKNYQLSIRLLYVVGTLATICFIHLIVLTVLFLRSVKNITRNTIIGFLVYYFLLLLLLRGLINAVLMIAVSGVLGGRPI